MKKGYFLYGAAVVFALCYALGMQQYSGWYVLILTLLFPFLEIIACWCFLRGNLRADVDVAAEGMDGDNLENVEGRLKKLRVILENDASFFPVNHGEIVLDIENMFLGKRRRLKLSFSVEAGEAEYLALEDEFSYPGKYRVHFRRICVYDFLGLVPIPLEWLEPKEITLMPEPIGDLQSLVLNGEEWEGDSGIYSHIRIGSDVSELLDIREYRRGDMRNRIHWKQTEKRGKLMVKDFGFPLDFGIGLFIDLNWKTTWRMEEKITSQLQSAYLISLHLIMEGIPFILVWQDETEQLLIQKEIWTEKDLYESFAQLLKGRIYSSETCLAALYREAGGRKLQEACYFSSDRVYDFEYIWTLLEAKHLQIKRSR